LNGTAESGWNPTTPSARFNINMPDLREAGRKVAGLVPSLFRGLTPRVSDGEPRRTADVQKPIPVELGLWPFLENLENTIIARDRWPIRTAYIANAFHEPLGLREDSVDSLQRVVRELGVIEAIVGPDPNWLGGRKQPVVAMFDQDRMRVFAALCWQIKTWVEGKRTEEITWENLVSETKAALGESNLAKVLHDPPYTVQRAFILTAIVARERRRLESSVSKPDEPAAAESPAEPAPAAPPEAPEVVIFAPAAADEAKLTEPFTMREEPTTMIVAETDGLREEITAIRDESLREYLTGVYQRASRVMEQKNETWPVPAIWVYKVFQEVLEASYGEIHSLYQRASANKCIRFEDEKGGKNKNYVRSMDFATFLAFAALNYTVPNGPRDTSGRPNWVAIVTQAKEALGEAGKISARFNEPQTVNYKKSRSTPNPSPPSTASTGLVARKRDVEPEVPKEVGGGILLKGAEARLDEMGKKPVQQLQREQTPLDLLVKGVDPTSTSIINATAETLRKIARRISAFDEEVDFARLEKDFSVIITDGDVEKLVRFAARVAGGHLDFELPAWVSSEQFRNAVEILASKKEQARLGSRSH